MKSLVIILGFFTSVGVLAKEFKCINGGKYRYLFNNQYKVIKTDFCLNHYSYEIISKDCIANEKCMAKEKYQHLNKLPQKAGPRGNPSHNRCYYLDGRAKMIEYFDQKKWNQASICLFSDASFIDIENRLD